MIKPLRQTELLPGTLQNLFYPPAREEYTYFRRTEKRPFTDESGPLKAAWAADAAMLAYAKYSVRPVDGEVPEKFAVDMPKADLDENFKRAGLVWEQIGNWGEHGTQGYFAGGPDYAILAFRGTEADDPADLVTDLRFNLSPEAERYGGAARKVHLGFQKALDSVWDEVCDKVKRYRENCQDKEICLTGHSLGGALATLAFSRLADDTVSLYTIGCPRVGNEAFRNRMTAARRKGIYRFVNDGDLVAHIPIHVPLEYPYYQTPTECQRFAADGQLSDVEDDSFKDDFVNLARVAASVPRTIRELRVGMTQDLSRVSAPDSLVDHSPARYCFRLWDCV